MDHFEILLVVEIVKVFPVCMICVDCGNKKKVMNSDSPALVGKGRSKKILFEAV